MALEWSIEESKEVDGYLGSHVQDARHDLLGFEVRRWGYGIPDLRVFLQ